MGRLVNRVTRWSALCVALFIAQAAVPAVKNLAIVTAAGSKLTDLPLADLTKMCKGTMKAWPDGKAFTIVMKDPASPEMHVAVSKLFGTTSAEAKATIEKLNESRQTVKIVESDEELLRTVDATPGSLGIVDVYSINSAVKVLRIDGKLPFDVGYVFKGN